MTRILLHTKTGEDEIGRPHTLEYYLISEEQADMEQYGAEIVLRCGTQEAREQCLRVTPIASAMTQVIDRLAENTVTPATMRELLQELL